MLKKKEADNFTGTPSLYVLRFMRWPRACAAAPLNPSRGWLAFQGKRLPAIRLGFALSGLETEEAKKLLRAAARWSVRLYVADYTLPQRNLAFPAYWLARLAARGTSSGYWGGGALWGLADQLGLEPDYEKIILGGAAVLARFSGHGAS